MNNEEKILAILEKQGEMLTDLKESVDKRFDQVDKRFNQVEERLDQVDKQFNQVDKRFNQVEQRLDQVDKQFDQVDKRFNQIEERLDELDTRSLRSAVILETDVAKNIRLVYEGQELLRQKMDELTPKDRVEALEGDVALLKDVIKLMRMEIAELKNAQ